MQPTERSDIVLRRFNLNFIINISEKYASADIGQPNENQIAIGKYWLSYKGRIRAQTFFYQFARVRSI